jgi:hypothetical protein
MDRMFDNLRMATLNCIEQRGASRNEELFEFRNAATFSVIHQLLSKYDCLLEQATEPVATSSLGSLTAAEAALLQAFRQSDDRSKRTIRIAADVGLQMASEFASKDRCDVVNIGSAQPPKD